MSCRIPTFSFKGPGTCSQRPMRLFYHPGAPSDNSLLPQNTTFRKETRTGSRDRVDVVRFQKGCFLSQLIPGGISDDGPAIHNPNPVCKKVGQKEVMRGDQQSSIPLLQGECQILLSSAIKIVGWLIKQQQLGLHRHDRGQGQSFPFP